MEKSAKIEVSTMDGVQVKKFMLKKAQIALKNLGSTNRARWVIFSPFDEITPSQFSKQMLNYEVTLNPAEVYAIWKICGIKSKIMKFEDFIKFLYFDMPPSAFDQDSYLSFFELVKSRRHILMPHFVGCDPENIGFIKISDFFDICHSVLPQATDMQISLLSQNYDTQNNGSLNYFLMLSDFNSAPKEIPSNMSRHDETKSNSLIFSENTFPQPNMRFPGKGGRGPLDPEVFLEANKPRIRRNSFSDAEIFPSKKVTFSPSLNGRRFDSEDKNGAKTPQRVSEAPKIKRASISDLIQAKQNIAASISKMGSAQEFFSRWQNGTVIGAEEIHNGILAQIQYDFPMDLLYLLVQNNGGPFTLSEFVSLISDATSLKSQRLDFSKLRKETEEDVVLTRIAQRTMGTEWESAVCETTSPETFTVGLRKVGLYMTPDDLRGLYDRLGTNGLIRAVKEKSVSVYAGNNIPP